MNLQLLSSSTPPWRARMPNLSVDLSVFRRPFGLALAAALVALMHGGVLFWYLEQPLLAPFIAAMPLPTIDIALSAPDQEIAPQPAKPAKPLPKPKPKSLRKNIKSKPKPHPEKIDAAREQPREDIQEAAPAGAPPAPVRAEAASPRAETYTPASSNADYLNNPRPVYPSVARRRHWEGLLLLRVFVTAEGHCGKVSVSRSSGHNVLDEAALEAVSRWRFVPAKTRRNRAGQLGDRTDRIRAEINQGCAAHHESGAHNRTHSLGRLLWNCQKPVSSRVRFTCWADFP